MRAPRSADGDGNGNGKGEVGGGLFCVGDVRGGRAGRERGGDCFGGVWILLLGFFPGEGERGRFDAVSILLMDGAEERRGASFFLSFFCMYGLLLDGEIMLTLVACDWSALGGGKGVSDRGTIFLGAGKKGLRSLAR